MWNMIYLNAFMYSPFFQFVIIFIIVFYLKKYANVEDWPKMRFATMSLIGFVGLFIHTYIINIIHIHLIHIPIMQNTLNPWVLLIGFSLFYYFKKMRLQNKTVNYLSSLSLLIYLIDENYVVRSAVKPLFWYIIYEGGELSINNLILWIGFFTVLSFIVCSVLASLYLYVYNHLISYYCLRIDGILTKIFDNSKIPFHENLK